MNATQFYRLKLQEFLAHPGGMNQEQVNAIVAKFDVLTARTPGSHQDNFRFLIRTYGNQDENQACASIQDQLEKLNREHPGICTDGRQRLKSYISRFNNNVKKLEVELDVGDRRKLLPHQLAALSEQQDITLKMPDFAKERTYVSEAKEGQPKLELDIKF